MTLSELQNNQVVTYRLGRHGRSSVLWGPWQTGPIYVCKRDVGYKDNPAGQLLTLTPMNTQWAEYSWRSYRGNGFFDAEDYCMEIKELV